MQYEIPHCCHLSAPSSWKPIKENLLFSRPSYALSNRGKITRAARNTVFLDFLPLHGQFAAGIPRREAKPTYRFHHGDDVDDLRVVVLPPPLFLYEFFHVSSSPCSVNVFGIHSCPKYRLARYARFPSEFQRINSRKISKVSRNFVDSNVE